MSIFNLAALFVLACLFVGILARNRAIIQLSLMVALVVLPIAFYFSGGF